VKFHVSLLILIILPSLAISASNKNTINNTTYKFSFTKMPNWYYLHAVEKNRRLFDVIRLYSFKKTSGYKKKSLRDYIAARIFLEVLDTKGQRIIPYSKKIIRNLRHQGFSVKLQKIKNKKTIPFLYFLLYYKPRKGSHERDIWLSLHIFRNSKGVFLFSGSAHSKRELKSVSLMFATLKIQR